MANLADIISGAVEGSQLVRVRLSQADGAVILVYRGNVQLGSDLLSGGLCEVTLSLPLVAGDVIQSSVGERGQQTGLPVTVIIPSVRVTGWKTPTEIEVIDQLTGETLLLPADLFFRTYGYLPASIYDPAGSRAVVYPEYQPDPITTIQFSLLIKQTPGTTYVTVQNVTGIRGAALVKWLDSEEYGSDLSRSFTAGTTLSLSVKGSNDSVASTRSLTIVVDDESVTPTAGDIGGVVHRFQNGPYIRLLANSTKPLQGRLQGVNDWQDFSFEEATYQECFFTGIAPGAYTYQVRVSGDTNPDNWRSITITKP